MSVVEFVKPNDFFLTRVGDAVEKLNTSLSPDLEHYVVNLLCEFIKPNNMMIDELDLLDTPLALIYKKALESSPQMQLKVYKRLGDISLYVAGYFQDSLNRKTVGAEYYISMGSSAYQTASQITRIRHNELHFTKVYQNLAKEFSKLVSVMTIVANGLPTTVDQGKILKMISQQEIISDDEDQMPN